MPKASLNKKYDFIKKATTLLVCLVWIGGISNTWTAEVYASPFAYISNVGDNTVSVIDTASNTVVATVPVGHAPRGVAVNHTATRIYVTNWADGTVSVIDTSTNIVTATIPVGNEPYGAAVNPTGTRVYVTNFASDTVSVIDTVSNAVVDTVPVGIGPFGIAVSRVGTWTRAYVVNNQDHTVSVIDTNTNTVIDLITVEPSPYGIAVNPTGTQAYVTHWAPNYIVSVIDTTSNAVTATVPVGTNPFGVASNLAGTKVYVTNHSDNTVSEIDTAANSVTAVIGVGTYPLGVTVNRAGTRVYAANSNSNTVSVIDTTTNTVVATVPVGSTPYAFGEFISQCTPATFASRYPLGFGQTEPVITGRWGGDAISVQASFRGHLGVDYAAGLGTPVAAVACGRVCKIDDVGKTYWGKYVLIHHDLPDGTARHSLYAHLSTVATSEGRDVLAGEGVGLSGETGKVRGPHLHFGILDDKFCKAGKGYSGKSFPESLESQDAGGRTYYNPSLFVEDWK